MGSNDLTIHGYPPMNRCGSCGAEWLYTHTCPNAPRSVSTPQTIDMVRVASQDPMALRAVAAEHENAALRFALRNALVALRGVMNPGDATTRDQHATCADDPTECDLAAYWHGWKVLDENSAGATLASRPEVIAGPAAPAGAGVRRQTERTNGGRDD